MPGLDGLRGIAALVVLVHHTLLLTPALLEPHLDPESGDAGGWAWGLAYTPLHLLWDGQVAVVVFFVLSGFVLCLPAASGKAGGWVAYYPQRLLRLYLPVWCAVALALAWQLLPHRGQPGMSSWLTGHDPSAGLGAVVKDLVLVVGQPGGTITVLWSLKWEVVFSLLLPAYIAFAAYWRRLLPVKVVVLLALLVAGAVVGPVGRPFEAGPLFHLPVFAAGCLMAFEWERLGRLGARLSRPWWAVLSVASVLLLSSYWLAYSVMDGAAVGPVTRVLQVLGAALAVFLAGQVGRVASGLSWRPVQWLGSRSFSLYLVHEPLVVAVGFALGPTSAALALAVTVPAALVLSEVFFRFVERPSHRAARAVGRIVRDRVPEPLATARASRR